MRTQKMLANYFDVSQVRERNEEILQEVRANRIGKRLRKGDVDRYFRTTERYSEMSTARAGAPGKKRSVVLPGQARRRWRGDLTSIKGRQQKVWSSGTNAQRGKLEDEG